MDKVKLIEEKIEKELKMQRKEQEVTNGKLVNFERDYEIKDDELVEYNAGYFYLYEVKNIKIKIDSQQELVPFVWDESRTVKENKKQAQNLARKYTKTFNASDEDARNMLQNDLYYLADWGMTFTDALNETKGELAQEGTEIAVGFLKEVVVTTDEVGTNSLINKGVYSETEVKKKQSNNLAEVAKLITGIAYNEAGKEWTSETYSQLAKKTKGMKGKANITKDMIRDFIADWCGVYRPAILAVRRRLEERVEQGEISENEKDRIFLRELNKEIQLNRIAARVMGMIMKLGTALVQTGVLQLILLGGALVISAQPVSAGVKEAVRSRWERGEIDEEEVINEIVKNLKKELNLKELLCGQDILSLLFGTNTDDPMIAEIEIDGPGVADMFEITGDSLIELDFKGVVEGLNLQDKQKYKNEIRGVKYYYGSVPAMGNLMSKEAKQDRDESFVAFFEIEDETGRYNNIMKKIIDDIFKKEEGTKQKLLSFKRVEYAADVPRLIHTPYGDRRNQIIAYNYSKNKDAAEIKDYYENVNKNIYGWMTEETKQRDNTLLKENQFYKKVTEIAPKPYLKHLKDYFSQDYLRNKLLKKGLEIGTGRDYINIDYCVVFSISLLAKLAQEYNLDLAEDNLSYQDILNAQHNQVCIQQGLAGKLFDDSEYDYLVLDQGTLNNKSWFSNEHEFFQAKTDTLYGTAKEEGKDNRENEFWSGVGRVESAKETQVSKRKSRLIINGEEIGQTGELKREEENYWQRALGRKIYTQEIEKDDGRVLEMRYIYDNDRLGSDELIIKYGYQRDELITINVFGHKYEIPKPQKRDEIVIKEYLDCDYGIDIPDKVGVLPGSRFKGELV